MGMVHHIANTLAGSWAVAGQMAPYLLFGFAIAGGLSVIISPDWVERHLGGRGWRPLLKAVLFGIPLPLCSCGVIPVTASIRNHGASPGATTGFLLATPQTGVDSILATWGLLGPVLGVFRPLVALGTGLVGGGLVALLVPEEEGANGENAAPRARCTAECCTGDPARNTILRALRYGFITLPKDIGKALLVGILIAGLIATLVPRDSLVHYLGGGLGAMAAMMLLGIPIYVCSTASIPIAVGFMHMGASPGAALVFLISGPATNAATIAMVWTLLGRRTTIIYLATVAGGAFLSGLGLDLLYQYLGGTGFSPITPTHETGLGWLHHLAAIVLLAVLGSALLGAWIERHRGVAAPQEDNAGIADVTLDVTGMTCSHCSATVTRALLEAQNVTHAEVDLARGRAIISGANLDAGALAARVRNLGYDAEVAE